MRFESESLNTTPRGNQLGMHRRGFLQAASAIGASGLLGWRSLIAGQADELRRRGRSCIVLWMQGGPSQFETFSPKPDHANGGETKAIATSVPGIQIADNFPHVARVMDDVAIIRSMTSKEGNHQRASFLMQTGYLPTASVRYPAFGSVVAHELASSKLELPAFVRIGGKGRSTLGGGLLGSDYDPFAMARAGRPPENTRTMTSADRFQRRLGLLQRLEAGQADGGLAFEAEEHRKLYRKTKRMILSPDMKVFDLEQEPTAARSAYGESPFGAGCLLARRLVEAGVPFVEVDANGWDTHFDNFNRSRTLSEAVDQPFARLIRDLKQRGLLDSTLVVWMGEFGRTPKVTARGGRNHFPGAFNVALAGGGISGGQVIGETDSGGATVTDRPVTVPDLMQTFCRALAIDPDTENYASNGRPIKVVDEGAPVDELFS